MHIIHKNKYITRMLPLKNIYDIIETKIKYNY